MDGPEENTDAEVSILLSGTALSGPEDSTDAEMKWQFVQIPNSVLYFFVKLMCGLCLFDLWR